MAPSRRRSPCARGARAEANGVSDNPLVFGEDVLSGGNFHAAPVGFVADFMAIAVAELGSMSERRIDLLARRVNPNLKMFLTDEPGVESGFMIAHVTAAALASENKTLAHPASVDTIPTSAGQEDHVSMAPWAGHKLLAACDNTATVLAIELLAAPMRSTSSARSPPRRAGRGDAADPRATRPSSAATGASTGTSPRWPPWSGEGLRRPRGQLRRPDEISLKVLILHKQTFG
jgi:hypothetical protein